MGDRPGGWRLALGRAVLALVPAAILGFYVRVPSWAVLAYVALVPWTLLYTDDRRPRAALWPYALGAWATWIALYPGCYSYGWFTPPFLGVVCFWTWLPFAPALRAIHRRFALPRALSVPLVWVGVEWFRSELTIGQFDLYRLGGTQARYTALIQIAEVTGVYGVTFLVGAVNGLIADVVFAFRDHRARPSWRRARARLAWTAGMVALAFVAAWGYGAIRLAALEFEPGPRLAVVQPNVRHLIRNLRGVHLTEMVMTEELVPPGSADLVVWPENAIMDDIRRPGPYREDLAWLASRKESWLLVGALGFPEEHPGHTTNSAFLLDTSARIMGRYDKQVLFPWSEYVPQDANLERLSPALYRAHRALARTAWGFLATGVPGSGMTLMHLPWNGGAVPFGVLVCVENAVPPVPAAAGRMGARFLVNITSEGDVGGPVQEQLLRMSILRAVENRIAYVRAGNTGISGFIDPAGRIQSILVGERGGTINDAGTLLDRVALASGGPTPYARSRDAFAKICALAALLLWGIAAARSKGRATASVVVAVVLSGCVAAPPLGEDPGTAAQALDLGRQRWSEGRPREALEELARACGEPEACGAALQLAAEVFEASGRPETGAEFFTAVIARYPELAAEAHGYRGYLLEQALQVDEAEREYLRSLELRPSARVLGLLGNLQIRRGRWSEAVAAYRRGIEINPRADDLRYMLGYAQLLSGDAASAKANLEAVLADDPRQARAWTTLAEVYLLESEPVAAKASLERALEVDPEHLEARFLLARMALRSGDLPETHRLLGEILALEAALGRGPRREL